MTDDRINDPVTEWIATHSKELSKHAGKYVGINDNNYQIVASGSTSIEVSSIAEKEYPDSEIIIFKVPSKSLSI